MPNLVMVHTAFGPHCLPCQPVIYRQGVPCRQRSRGRPDRGGLDPFEILAHMLILVVEDDAQDGVDHVDGHRTVALAISPYIRRGAVDSTFYSQTSFAKTIEQIMGLPLCRSST